jgi:hypothetical protein
MKRNPNVSFANGKIPVLRYELGLSFLVCVGRVVRTHTPNEQRTTTLGETVVSESTLSADYPILFPEYLACAGSQDIFQ